MSTKMRCVPICLDPLSRAQRYLRTKSFFSISHYERKAGLRTALACVAVACAITQGRVCYAATAEASTAGWIFKDADEGSASNWARTFTWASKPTTAILWTSGGNGANTADLVAYPLVTGGETKFTLPAVTAKTWATFQHTDPTPQVIGKSYASVQGTGSSNVTFPFYGANWKVFAGGFEAAAPGSSYFSSITGTDPMGIYPSDISGLTSSTYSVFIPFTIRGGSSFANVGDVQSGYGFDVAYTTTAGTADLLNISVAGTNVVVTSPASSLFTSQQLKLLRESSPDGAPLDGTQATPGTLITTSDLTSSIQSSLVPNPDGHFSIGSSISLGIVLSGIPRPTQTLADGALAEYSVAERAFSANVDDLVPEPMSLVLLATAAATGLLVRRRRV